MHLGPASFAPVAEAGTRPRRSSGGVSPHCCKRATARTATGRQPEKLWKDDAQLTLAALEMDAVNLPEGR